MGPRREGPGWGRGQGRAAAAGVATDSEEEAAAEQGLRRLEPAEESSGSSDESDDGGSVAGAIGKGEGARRERLRERRQPRLGLVGKELPKRSVPSRIPAPAQLSSSGSAAGLGERSLKQTRVGVACP